MSTRRDFLGQMAAFVLAPTIPLPTNDWTTFGQPLALALLDASGREVDYARLTITPDKWTRTEAGVRNKEKWAFPFSCGNFEVFGMALLDRHERRVFEGRLACPKYIGFGDVLIFAEDDLWINLR